MKTIAKKIFMTIIIGGLFVFAVNLGVCDMSNASAKTTEYIDDVQTIELDGQDFWSKFRESVMRDRDEEGREPADPPPQTVERNPADPPAEAERNAIS